MLDKSSPPQSSKDEQTAPNGEVSGSNPDVETKVCTRCNESKDVSLFSQKTKSRLRTWCKSCHSKYEKQWYAVNKEKHCKTTKKNRLVSRERSKEFVDNYKLGSCTDCKKYFFPWQMEFDHLRDKSFNIGDAVGQGLTTITIKNELEKCELVCANCHNDRTYRRQQFNLLVNAANKLLSK